jgi:hypothetical protein
LADKIFLTCCALHNWLLEVDGLDERWTEGVASGWEGSLGDHNVNEISRAILNLHNQVDVQNYDLSGLRAGNNIRIPHHTTPSSQHDEHINDDDSFIVEMEQILCEDHVVQIPGVQLHPVVQSVRLLSLDDFRSRLVVHFNIAFQRNEVRWPRCRRDTPHHV